MQLSEEFTVRSLSVEADVPLIQQGLLAMPNIGDRKRVIDSNRRIQVFTLLSVQTQHSSIH